MKKKIKFLLDPKNRVIFFGLLFIFVLFILSVTVINNETKPFFLKYLFLCLFVVASSVTFYKTNEIFKKTVEIERNYIIKFGKNRFYKNIEGVRFFPEAVLRSSTISLKELNHFILLRQKSVIGGDFYWAKKYSNKTLIAIGDCTGHGVSAAFLSILGKYLINKIISSEKNLSANKILDKLRDEVIKAMKGKYSPVSGWGMDIAILLYDKESKEIQYSGANIPLLYIRKAKSTVQKIEKKNFNKPISDDYSLFHIKPDKMPIGLYPISKPFKKQLIKLKNEDTLYLFSDGLTDQAGGKKGRRLMLKRVQTGLLKVQNKEMNEQKLIIQKFLSKWMNGKKQDDDIILFGLKI